MLSWNDTSFLSEKKFFGKRAKKAMLQDEVSLPSFIVHEAREKNFKITSTLAFNKNEVKNSLSPTSH